MADTLVESGAQTVSDEAFSPWGPYWINTTTAVIIFIDSGNDISFARTTDGGVNWTTTEIQSNTTENVAAWFDQETPGDTGTLVHVAFLRSASGPQGDVAYYQTVDVSDGSLGTERLVDFTVTVGTTGPENRVAITKTRSGNLIYAFSTPNEIETYRSTNDGEDWEAVADVYETATEEDYVLLFPANTGDDDDAVALFWDRSANEVTVKMFDNSVPSWTEFTTTVIAVTATDATHLHMDGAIRHSDSHLLMGVHDDFDNANDDFLTRDITVDNITTPTITSKTNIFTGQAESGYCAVFINQQNDDVSVVYQKGGTLNATVDTVYQLSTDGMGSWGGDVSYSEETADDHRTVQAGRTVGNDGGFFQPCWYDDDQTELRVNLVNDVAIASVSVAAGTNYDIRKYPRGIFRGIMRGAIGLLANLRYNIIYHTSYYHIYYLWCRSKKMGW